MRGLLKLRLRRRALGRIPHPTPVNSFAFRNGKAPVTVKRLFERLNAFLSDNTVVVADVGDALFGAATAVWAIERWLAGDWPRPRPIHGAVVTRTR